MTKTRKTWARDKKKLNRDPNLKKKLKQVCNRYYRSIKSAK